MLSYLVGVTLLALLSFYCGACVAARRPAAGSLDWIARCDRPPVSLPGSGTALGARDLLVLLALCLPTGLIWLLGTLWPLSFYRSMPSVQLVVVLLKNVLAPVTAVALAYASMKRLFGRTLSAALAAAVIAVDLAVEPVTLAFAAAGLYFLVRFLTVPEPARFVELLPHLIGCVASLAVGCWFDVSLFILLTAALLAVLFSCVGRLYVSGRPLRLIACLLAAVLSAVLAWIAVFLPGGLANGMEFPGLLLQSGYYRMISTRLAETFLARIGGRSPLDLLRVQYDWLPLAAGAAALLAALVRLFWKRDSRCALLPLWSAAQLLAFCYLGSYALPLSCALCLCRVWAGLEERHHTWLAALGAVCLLTFLLGGFARVWIST